jgi:hypothetical protein
VTDQSFAAFVEAVVLPGKGSEPHASAARRAPHRGNFDVAGEFRYRGRNWKVHADTHYETPLCAYEATKRGADPFVEAPTKRGMSLDLDVGNLVPRH